MAHTVDRPVLMWTAGRW